MGGAFIRKRVVVDKKTIISVSALNLQAIPYIVVEMRLLAPFQ
jgi:hypothetical protein